jgi:hypothetical protein
MKISKRLMSRIIVLACASLVLFAAASSGRAPEIAPARGLTTGFFDDASFSGADAPVWFGRAVASGATVVRLEAFWSIVAAKQPADPTNPADPAYQWAALDQQVEQAVAAGLTPIISVTSAPAWAEAQPVPATASPGSWEPDAADYQPFAQALATRYSGTYPDPAHPGQALPRVRYYQAWNEPNLSTYLAPQWKRVSGAWVAESPVLYRGLLNAFYAGIKAAAPTAVVVSAGTSPFGDPPGGQRIAPALFDRDLFCISASMQPLPCPNPAHFDVLAHHPYAVGGPYSHALNADDVSIPDLSKLERPLAVAERTGRVLPAGPKPIWVTEISYDSDPPDPTAVPMKTFVRWTAETLYELWSEGVSVVTWFLIRDQPPIPSYADSYQSGMYFLDGTPKLAQQAFLFPLVVDRRGPGQPIIWTRVPAAGTLQIEGLLHGTWRVVFQTAVSAHEVLTGHIAANRGESFRASVGSQSSLVWAP